MDISDVVLLMKRWANRKRIMDSQRLIDERRSFEDLVRENLNQEQVDSIIEVPEWTIGEEEINDY